LCFRFDLILKFCFICGLSYNVSGFVVLVEEKIRKVVRMAATAASSLQIATRRPSMSSPSKILKAGTYIVGANPGNASWDKLSCTRQLSNLGCLRNHSAVPTCKRPFSFSTRAMSESSENKAPSGLPIDLRGWLAYLSLNSEKTWCYLN